MCIRDRGLLLSSGADGGELVQHVPAHGVDGGSGCLLYTSLEYNGVEKELSGGEDSTTNNRMALTAVIRGLQALKETCTVELYSDSKYVIDALEKGWAWGWKDVYKRQRSGLPDLHP